VLLHAIGSHYLLDARQGDEAIELVFQRLHTSLWSPKPLSKAALAPHDTFAIFRPRRLCGGKFSRCRHVWVLSISFWSTIIPIATLTEKSSRKRSQGVKFTTHWFWRRRNFPHFYGKNRKLWEIKHLAKSMGKT